jgi:quercetin dioxygenase-like cupin family protein
LILSFSDYRDGVETEDATCAVYDVARNEARFGRARVDGHALVWELGEAASPDAGLTAELDVTVGDGWLLRCDRVDFPPGGVAYTHTHPGPGIRCLLFGAIRIESGGETHEYEPFEPWFESGPEPVFAAADAGEPSAFVRVLVLPREWEGKRTIRYVDPADEDKPKLQWATVFFEQPIRS